jgi:tight adherence protein B
VIRRTTHLLGALAVAGVIAVGATTSAANAEPAADQSSGGGVSITQVDASHYPRIRVAFGADDVKGDTPSLDFFEDGDKLAKVSLYRGPIGKYENKTHTDLMLALDTSLSMNEGTRREDAIAAARELITHAGPDDNIGLVTFGGKAEVLVKPTTNHALIGQALDTITLQNRTTMFDGVSLAAQAFDKHSRANRAIVLLSDGTDVGSHETLDEAAGEAIKANAPIFAVAIREHEGEQPKDMATLGNGTEGELKTIVGTAELHALFDDLGRRLLQPYWIEYQTDAPRRSMVEFGIGAGGASRPAAIRSFRAVPSTTASGRSVTSPPKAPPAAKPIIPLPSGLLGVLLAAVPFGALVFFGSWRFLEKRSRPDVIARIERYTARATSASVVAAREESGSGMRRMSAPIARLGETLLGKSKFFERTRFRAEQAAIAIKPSELFAAMVIFAGFGFLLGLMFGNILLIIGLPLFLGFLPNLWLRMKARKRRNRFEDQLADVLGGIASSLKAGHSFNQALNAMIKDAPQPTSEEFSRVMTEARLGMPIEDALGRMADRMGSADFEFAVTTVNIQRTVGGSLADILDMVGDTVRNRQQFRKKVKALTSMGQMSAYVLLAMPIFMGVVITIMSPTYMKPMFTTPIGHGLLAAGAVSMLLGYFACMKVVSVKV